MGLCNCTLLILLASLGRSLCQTACGGDIKDKTGIISSPNFPSSYPDSSNCHWTLHAPENQVLYIRFLHVDFAASYNNECADYVSVFDGDTNMSPIIIQLCGYKTPEEVAALRFRSTGKNLHIYFYSDYSQHNSGFDAQFTIQDCPPFTFGNETCNKQCICAQANTRHCNSINGTCICKQGWTGLDCSIDIDECRSDVVEVCPDNYQLCVNTPGTFTCQCKPGMVMNSTGQCEVAASSHCSVKICSHVCAKLPSGSEQCYCPMDMHLIGNQCKDCDHLSFGENCRLGCICSDSNTERCYAPTGDCKCKPGWRGSTCSDDIDECSLAIQRCVGNTTCINTIGSYYCAACNNVITATSGVIVSQNHPNNYPNNLNCSWLIISPNKQATISLRFSEIDLEYSYDVVSIFDGTNTAAPRIAVVNSRENVFIRSTQSNVFILFETDGSGVGTGFSGTFQVEETPGCGQVISNVSGSLTLQKRPPLIPGNVFFCYLSFVDQQSELYTVKLQSLELGRSLDCNNGYLKVYNLTRGTRYYDYQKYCYNNIPSLIRSKSNEMLIIYFLNESGAEPKFNATYLKTDCNWKYGDKCQSDCKCNRSYTKHCNNLNGHCECSNGMKETDCSQDINECTELSSSCTAPTECRNMFQSYECDLNKTQIHGQFDCISNNGWHNYYHVFIKGPPNNVVSLSVSNFNMTYPYGSTKCYYYMDIYDGMDRNSRLIGHYCESKIPKLLRTTQNVMLIIIENTSGRTMCHAEYQIEPCAPFMYGPACSKMCPCLKENTLTCDNLYGVCHCKAGWTGKDCSTDLDECLYVKNCTQNSECTNTPGSYQCVCVDGYEKDTSGRLCTPSMQCPEQDRNRCSHACVLVAGKPQCRCPPNLVLDETEQLNCVAPFYSPFGEVIHFAQGEKHSKLPLNVKVPFGFNKVVTSVFVSRQGVMLFDNNQHVNLSIHEAALHDIKLAAPLWSQFDLERGNVSYYFIERCRLDDTQRALTQTEVQMVERARKSVTEKNAFYDFEVKTLLVLTWQDLQLPQENAKFTFQAIYISGYEKQILQGQPVSLEKETGHIIFIYHKGKDHWTSTAPAAIGFTTGDMENDITKLNPNVLSVLGSSQFDLNAPGVMVFNVGYADGPEQKCEQYLCQYSAFKDSDFYRDEINELYKCPCSSERLGFQWDLYETRGDIDCYAIKQGVKNRFLPSNSRNKLCCYPRPSLCDSSHATRFTSYLQNDPNGGHVLIADPWLTSANRREALNNLEAHKSCCLHSSSQMCHQFYQLFPDMECSVQVTFVSPFALGDPHITTLDGLTYAMNGWGEYILLAVPSKHFVLQARTGRVVSNKGQLLNATVFTAFAARQSTEASVQVELSLSNTTMNIYVDGQDVTNEFYKSRSYRMSSNSLSVSREVKCQNNTEQNSVKVKFSS
ncbi:mucin-like protein isoform X1, partial [Biomphalaria pfeifferi]